MPERRQGSTSTETDGRVRQRAERLWRAAGRPAVGVAAYLEEARQLIAIEDNPKAGTEPLGQGYNNPGPWGEPVEDPRVALDNEGEFPTMTDQGEQESPHLPSRQDSDVSAHEGPQMKTSSKADSKADYESRIRERAYHLWVEAGRPHGRDQEHWEKAQRLIDEENERKPKRAGKATPADGAAKSAPSTGKKRSSKDPKASQPAR